MRAGRWRERLQLVVVNHDLAGEAGLELSDGAEVLGLDQVGERLADQDDHGIAPEALVVIVRSLVGGRGATDERVAPGRWLQAKREQPATKCCRQHDRNR